MAKFPNVASVFENHPIKRTAMHQYDSKLPLISLHIPKCGGTSFTEVLRSWFWPSFHAHYIAHDRGGVLPPYPHPVKSLLHKSRIKPMVIHGHFEDEADIFDYYPKAEQFITVLRDPLEMQLSLFWDHKRRLKEFGTLYWKGEEVEMEYGGDIDRWVAERPFYLMPFLPFNLTLENFKDELSKRFVHIGVVEELQASVNHLASRLGKQPVAIPKLNESQRDQLPSEGSIDAFRGKCELEYAIYNWALDLNTNPLP